MALIHWMLFNTLVFVIVLVMLLLVLNKPKNDNGSEVHGDLYKIKENVSTEEKTPMLPAGRLDTIQSL